MWENTIFPNTIYWNCNFPFKCCWLPCQILFNCVYMDLSRLSILFHWSLYLFLRQDHPVLNAVCVCVCVCVLSRSLSCVWLFPTPWTVACQAPLSMGLSWQEYCSGLPFPTPGDLSDWGIENASSALAGEYFTTALPRKPLEYYSLVI